jgi:GTP 3',8-cyclase
MIDNFSLRVSLTERCQLRCLYCRPAIDNVAAHVPHVSPQEWIRRIRLLAGAVPITKLRFTGGEPLLYPHLLEVVEGCSRIGIPDLALTTNALKLSGLAAPLKQAGLVRVNISLDSTDPHTVRRMTGGKLNPALDGIHAAKAAGLDVKLNAVVLRGINDVGVMGLLEFAKEAGVVLRFLEVMPIGPAAKTFDDHYVSGAEIMARLSEQVAFEALPYERGETSRDYMAHWRDGSQARCGFVLPTSDPFCDGCTRLRLTSEGLLFGCLAQPDAVQLLAAFEAAEAGDPAPLRDSVRRAMDVKKRPQAFRDQRAMIGLGG